MEGSDVFRIEHDVDDVERAGFPVGVFLVTTDHEHVADLDRQRLAAEHHQARAAGHDHHLPKLVAVARKRRMLGGPHHRQRTNVALRQVRPTQRVQPGHAAQHLVCLFNRTHDWRQVEATWGSARCWIKKRVIVREILHRTPNAGNRKPKIDTRTRWPSDPFVWPALPVQSPSSSCPHDPVQFPLAGDG